MATAPPPDYRDLFVPGSEPNADADTSAAPSAPPPAAAPYPPKDQQQQPPAPYPSQQQPAMYPPPAAVGGQVPYQGYPAPTYASPNQATNVVINQQQTQQQTTVIHNKKDSPNHLLHCIICFFCPWYLCIWLIICCIYGC